VDLVDGHRAIVSPRSRRCSPTRPSRRRERPVIWSRAERPKSPVAAKDNGVGDAMNGGQLSFSLHGALTQWEWSPFPLVALALAIAAAYWYLRAEWQLASRGRRWQGSRRAAFLGGLAAAELAVQSPVATYSMSYFQAHVIQHLLLMVVAPPLLALGAPSTLLLQTSSRRTKERWLAVLRSPSFAVLSHPLSSWLLYFGLMFIFFTTSLVNTAMTHMALMDLMNVLFLVGATLYWWPMVGIDPIIHWKMGFGARMFNILLGSAVEAFLGVTILAMSHPIATMYSLGGTHDGGALLWVSTEFITLGAFLPIYLQWMHSEDREAARADRRADRIEAAPQVRHVRGDIPNRPLSAWEAAWYAKNGTVPDFSRQDSAAPGGAAP
jgi:putative copper resistance protein D